MSYIMCAGAACHAIIDSRGGVLCPDCLAKRITSTTKYAASRDETYQQWLERTPREDGDIRQCEHQYGAFSLACAACLEHLKWRGLLNQARKMKAS